MESSKIIISTIKPSQYYKYGRDLIDQEKYAEALKFFDMALELNSNFYEAIYMRAVANKHLKNYDDAIKDLKSLIHPDMENCWKLFKNYHQIACNAYLDLAEILEIKKQSGDAMQYYAIAIKKFPQSVKVRKACAAYYAGKEMYDVALKAYTNIIDLIDENNIDAYISRAKIYLAQKKFGYALADFINASQCDLNVEQKNECMIYVSTILTQLQKNDDLKGISALALINFIENLPSNDIKLKLFTQCITEGSALYNALKREYQGMFGINMFDMVKTYISQIQYDANEQNYITGCNYLNQKKPDQAVKYFEEYFKHNTKNAFNLGCRFLECGADSQATKCFDRAYKDDEKVTSYNIGCAFLNYKRYDRAINCFNHAIKENQGEVDVYLKLGLAYLGLTDYKNALNNFHYCVNHNTCVADAWLNIAETYQHIGNKHPHIMGCYKNAIEERSAHPDGYIKRAKYCLDQKDYEPALKDYNTLINKLNYKDLPEVFVNRGVCNVHLKKPASALIDFYEAISLKPGPMIVGICKEYIVDILKNIKSENELKEIGVWKLFRIIRNLSDKDQSWFLATIIFDKNSPISKKMRTMERKDKNNLNIFDLDDVIKEIEKYYHRKFDTFIPVTKQCVEDADLNLHDSDRENNHGYRL